MKRLATSVFLIFFGFAVVACGSGETEQPLNGAFAEADGLSTGESSVDNPGSGEGQGDGRVLKPEGHKGMWFETEPEDPWEHYVWKSQRFVGDPIDLPKLKAKRPNDPLAGLPDVCDEKVIERMREVGFEYENLDSKGPVRSCYFFEKESIEGPFAEKMFNIAIDPTRPLERFSKNVNYEAGRSDVDAIGIDLEPGDSECGIAFGKGSSTFYARFVVDDPTQDVRSVCNLSEHFFQIFDNMSNI